MPTALWRILAARGCASSDDARAFLNPSVDDIPDPFALSGMKESVDIINSHIRCGRRICIWGDYDVDGVSAVAILLTAFKRLGVDAAHHIPSRTEGYGLNEAGVASLACDLLISVDCGVSEWAIIKKARQAGMSVIVTDHHEPPEKLPECPVINPLLSEYPNRHLCGAGVAFKLALALDPRNFDLIDIAALATVADVVPLLGENRAIVKLGLKRMNEYTRPGIRALALAAGAKGNINSQTVAFQLAPRLNASGRVLTAENALRLLLSNDSIECSQLACELNSLNQKRRELETAVLGECESLIAQSDTSRANCIVLAGEGWPTGVVGLAASRLVERYHMPTVLLSVSGESMTGSCRSVPGCDIHFCLTQVSDFLERFGGHSQAAGLTIKSRNFAAFKSALDGVITKTTPIEAFTPTIYYDCETDLSDVTPAFIRSLDCLEPTGLGNPPAAFLSRFRVEGARRIGRDGAHASFTAADATDFIRGVWFSGGSDIEAFSARAVCAVYSPFINEFRGEASAQMRIEAMTSDGLGALDASREDALVNSFITHALYNTPTRVTSACIGLEGLRARLADPRGLLVIACDLRTAQDILSIPEARGLDVHLGRYPADIRAHNAICILPVGELPKGYDTIIVAGAPAWLIARDAVEYDGAGACDWLEYLSTEDELREIYKACKAVCYTGAIAASGMGLCRMISEASGVTLTSAQAGIMVLRDMGLIEYEPMPVRLGIKPVFKCRPEQNALFCAISAIKRWGGSRT